MKRRIRPVERKATIEWTARGEGYVSADGRFLIAKTRGTWMLTDTRGPEILREQAARSSGDAKSRAEQIIEGEAMPE